MNQGALAMASAHRDPRRERGQVLALMVLSLVAVLGMVGLIVDGGSAWAHQRLDQNGADAASEAGATQLGKRIANTDPALGSAYWDGKVAEAVAASATANGITIPAAYYTDICGVLLTPGGTKATGVGDAAVVGAGSLPLTIGPAPADCPSLDDSVGPVAGVEAHGQLTSPVYFARILGISDFIVSTQATAVAGYLEQVCSGPSSGQCILLPVATFYNLIACDGPGNAIDSGTGYPTVYNQTVVLPICKNSSGNVGWLDFTGGGGGTAELIDCIERANSSDPCQSTIVTPSWWNIAQAGGTSSKPLEDALNEYDGEIVLMPIFNLMCQSGPDQSLAATPPNYGCPASEVCTLSDQGCNPNWYHLQPFAAFRLGHVYTNGNPVAECNPPWSDPNPDANDTTNCIIGEFVDYSIGGNGTVGPNPNGSGVIGVQLIK
jgi:hypothetical protein